MSIRTIGASTATRSAVTFALALAAVGGLATSSNGATTVSAQPAMTLSAPSGKEAGGQAITATTTTNKFYAGKTFVQFQSTTALTNNCQATFTATAANSVINATSTAIISTKKISVVVPNLTAASGAGTTQTWLVCAYAGNTAGTSKLLAKAGYTSAGAPALTALSANVQVPTYGGTTINVVGTGFAAGVNSATLGGNPLTDINVVDDTLFTATTPAHVAGAAALTVNTVGGTDTILSTAGSHYVFVDALQVSPTTGVTGTSVPLSIQGYGFNDVTWGTTNGTAPDGANAHVYLLKPSATALPMYDPQNLVIASNTPKTKAEQTECTNVLVISDTELTCTLDLAHSYSPPAAGAQVAISAGAATGNGLYQVAIVNDGGAAGKVTNQTALGGALTPASSAVFAVAPF